MHPAFELLAANNPTANFGEPTGLISQILLPADTGLLDQERALRTRLGVLMALMINLRVTTGSLTSTVESTFRGLHTTGLRWMKDGSATGATNLSENRFQTTSTRSLVTKIETRVVATLQRTSTDSHTNVLCFDVLLVRTSTDSTMFSLSSLPFASFLFSGAASLTTLVTPTVHG